MNVVDSSGWLEYFAAGPNASFFAPAIEDTRRLVVPTLSLHEVYKRLAHQKGEGDALQGVATMQQGTLADLTAALAVSAARLSLAHKLPLADSVMLATAYAHGAVFWTQDADFRGIEGVRFRERRSR